MIKLIFIAIFLPLTAGAYIENRNVFPMGDSEMLMANTGVALKGSSGAAFFNPAGLATLKQRKLSLSGNTYLKHSIDYSPLDTADGKDINFTSSGVQAIPSSVISTLPYEHWTFAFGVFVPEQVRSQDITSFSTADYEGQLLSMTDIQMLMIGPSAGTTLASGYDAGVGCSFVNMSQTQQRTLLLTPQTAGAGVTTGVNSSFVSFNVRSIVCQGGIQKDINETTRWGASVRLPSFYISGSVDFSEYLRDTSNTLKTNSGKQSKGARYDIPMDVTFGVFNKFNSTTNLLADISYQFPGSFELIDGSTTKYEVAGTFRFNFGIEYALSSENSLRGGIAFNPGTSQLSAANTSKEDMTSFTFGIERRLATSTMGIGVFSASSTGEHKVSSTQKGGLSTRAMAVLLTTGFIF